MSATPIAVPGERPGEIFIPALGKSFQQVELREDDEYDTIAIILGAIAAGAEFNFFRDIQNKNEQHTNIPQSRRIAAGDEVAVFRIGVHVPEAIGNQLPTVVDYKKLIGNGHVYVQFNRRLITSGPMVKYPTGYGVTAMSNVAAAAGNESISIGVPSVAAAPTLFVPQQLKDNDDIIAKLRFPDAQWAAAQLAGGAYVVPTTGAATVVSMYMRGVIKSPLGK